MESRKRRIYLPQIGVHTYLKALINNPPEGYEFILKDNWGRKNILTFLKKSKIATYLYKEIFKKVFNVFTLVNKVYYDKSPDNTDLILSTGTVVTENKPWIMKILDTPFSMAGNDYNLFIKNKDKIEGALTSDYCKRIIVHTESAKEHMNKYFSKKVMKKVIKISPAIPGTIAPRKKRGDNEVRFLFMGSINNPDEFFMKGGLEALETIRILSESYPNVNLKVRCKLPAEIKEQYNLPNVIFLEDQMDSEEIKRLYRESDVLIMPGYGGYFIMAYLEAFSYGLPIIALDTYGVNEFIKEGETGFIGEPSRSAPINVPEYPSNTRSQDFISMIKEKDPEVIKSLVEKTSIIVENPELLEKMGTACQRAFAGKYNNEKKLAVLKGLFDEALRQKTDN